MKYEIEIHALRPDGLARNGEPAKVLAVDVNGSIVDLWELIQIITGCTKLIDEHPTDVFNAAVGGYFEEAVARSNHRLSADYRDDLDLDQDKIADAIKYGKILAEGCTGWAAAANSWRDDKEVEACEFFEQFDDTREVK